MPVAVAREVACYSFTVRFLHEQHRRAAGGADPRAFVPRRSLSLGDIAWEQELLKQGGLPLTGEAIPLRDRAQPYPLSPDQQRIWFMEQVAAGEPVYNESDAVRIRGELKIAVLENALNVLVARHEILRTTIGVAGEHPIAVVHERWPLN